MAVTVQQAPSIALDEHYRIVEVDPSAEGGFGPLAGQILWDCFPGSEGLFRPYYDRARRTGEPEEFVQFYNGYVTRVRAEPRGELLRLYWHELHVIDAQTLDTLERSLTRTIELLGDEQAGALKDSTRASLTVIRGGRS